MIGGLELWQLNKGETTMTTVRKSLLLATFGTMFALLGTARAHADSIYEINVNTTSVAGTVGYLDFMFNPGAAPVDPASATLSGFTTDGTLGTPLGNIGDVTGSLPGVVQINNTDVNNEYTVGFTYGSFFDMFVDLDIPTISGNAQSGSSFLLTLDDSNFGPLLNDNASPSGQLVEIDLDTDGNPTVQNFSPNGEATVTAVPEPASLLLLATGLGALLPRRNKAAARNLAN